MLYAMNDCNSKCHFALLGPRQRMLAELFCFRLVCLSVHRSGHSNLVIFNQISSKFHIWIASIKLSFKFEYGFCPTNNNQDGRQNGPRLSVLVKLSPKLEYDGLCPITKMAANMAATCQIALVDTVSHLSPDFFQTATCIKGLFSPPLRLKNKNCFRPISSH